MDFGFFGKAFDMDFDGHLDAFERAADFATFMGLMDTAADMESTRNDALSSAGIDPDDLDFMDSSERREALEDVGLDPDDYDW